MWEVVRTGKWAGSRCRGSIVFPSVCLLAILLLAGSCSRGRNFSGRTLRVGYDNAPPYSLVSPDGSPAGLAVELLKEAALRRNIRLQWVQFSGPFDIDDVLSRGVVDLWPIVGVAQERLARIHIARPWIENNFFLVSRTAYPVATPGGAAGKRVNHMKGLLATEMSRKFLPAAHLNAVRGFENLLGPVCKGSADAVFLEARTLETLLLDRPADCFGIPLKVSSVPGAVSRAGIGAWRPSAAAAEALTEEIIAMAGDGTFQRIVDKWSSFSATETRSLMALQESRERDIVFFRSLWLLVAACLGLGTVAALALRARRTAERAQSIEAGRVLILRRLAQGTPLPEIATLLTRSLEQCCGRGLCAVHLNGAEKDLEPESGTVLPVIDSHGYRVGVLVVATPAAQLGAEQRKAIDGIRQLSALVAEHRMLHTELQIQASQDRLTGLANRSVFAGSIERLVGKPGRTEPAAYLFFMDLDRFKQVNDRFGHGTGDVYLSQAAQRIRNCFPSAHLVARLGGDEFAAIATGIDSLQAEAIAESVVEAFKSPFLVEGLRIVGGVSVGVSAFPQDGATSAELQRSADAALYDAKKGGRNRYTICSPEIRERAGFVVRSERLIRQALEHEWLEIFYQPQENLDGSLAGMEALVRIRHPELGLIPPANFIEIAEQAGLVTEIDAWVLAAAMKQYAEWRRAGLDPVRIAVNISRLDLSHAGLFQRVMASLEAYRLEPGALQIELTETVAALGTETAMDTLRQIRDAGISLALDDFGCGYSSLSCLHGMPVDTVKIDQSFVRRLDEETGSRSLIAAVIAAAQALHMTVIAEGVETENQRTILSRMGCDVLQGYYIGRPVNAIAAGHLLADRLPAVQPALEFSAA